MVLQNPTEQRVTAQSKNMNTIEFVVNDIVIVCSIQYKLWGFSALNNEPEDHSISHNHTFHCPPSLHPNNFTVLYYYLSLDFPPPTVSCNFYRNH